MAEYYHTNILLTNGNLIQEPVGEELNFHSSDLAEFLPLATSTNQRFVISVRNLKKHLSRA